MNIKRSISDAITPYFNPNILKIGFLCLWGGIPFMMTGSTMIVWLREYGLSYTTVGLFSLLHLPYALKFLWSPAIDHLRIPFLSKKLGQQRAWMVVVQSIAFIAFICLSQINPLTFPLLFVALSFLLTTAAATSDMILLAYPIHIIPIGQWGISESMGIFCYRLGILLGGACVLALSHYFAWSSLYLVFGVFLIAGPFVTLCLPPFCCSKPLNDVNFSFLNKAVLKPFKAFMCHPGWWSVLIFMFLYRLQDNLIGNMPTLFYLDLGFSKGEIAACQKVFGMWMSVLGGILGGALIRYQGYFKALCIGGIFHGLSGFCYVAQAWVGDSLPFLYVTTGVEDFSKGIAIVSLFSYQLTCCQKEYAVTQLALLTSFVNLSEVSVSSFSGFLADSFGWKWFFAFATTLGFLGIFWIKCLPALFLIRPRKESFR